MKVEKKVWSRLTAFMDFVPIGEIQGMRIELLKYDIIYKVTSIKVNLINSSNRKPWLKVRANKKQSSKCSHSEGISIVSIDLKYCK